MKAILSFIILSLLTGVAQATPYGVITANEFMSMDLSKTWMLPAGSDTLAGILRLKRSAIKRSRVRFSISSKAFNKTTPACPPSGSNDLYFKSDNNLYTLNSACVETQLGSGGGGAAVPSPVWASSRPLG